VTALETRTPAILLQKKTRKASSVPGISGKVAPTNRNKDMLSSGKEDDADSERNAIIVPSQQTPERS
jgi:hypothetical protein